MKSLAVVLSMLIGFSHAAYSKEYTIKVCKIPLKESLGVNISVLDTFYHVWLRGATPSGDAALSFETKDKEAALIVAGALVKSSVTSDDFDRPSVSCVTVFETDDDYEYLLKWSTIEHVYEKAKSYNYQAYGVYPGKNCGMVAKEAVTEAGLEFPFENINGQDNTAELLYGVGNAIEHGFNADNAQQIAKSALDIVDGVARNNENCSIQ